MDLGGWESMVAIVGGVIAAGTTLLGGAMWLGGWMARREKEGEDFSETDKKVGKLADNSTVALRDLERKVDEHIREDSSRFIQIADSLGRIEGALGIERR